MEQMVLPVLVVILFYLIIPGIGAFTTRAKWRWFRNSIIQTSLMPEVSYATLRGLQGSGRFRIIGNLQAIQGENVIWVKSRDVSVSAELAGVDVYVLPVPESAEEGDRVERYEVTLSEVMPTRVPWNSIFSLPEGTELLVSGTLYVENGAGVFKRDSENPLIVVIFEGPAETIVPRSIWVGRHKNEYWNRFTPISVTAGSFALFILAYTMFKIPILRLQAIITVTMSLIPVIPFIPPGVILFFFYRVSWKRARILRAERDLLRLPLRYFPDADPRDGPLALPDGVPYGLKRFPSCSEALKDTGRGSIRTSTLLDRRSMEKGECWAFGVLRDGNIMSPADPLSELVFIPGNPQILAEQCNTRARWMELLSGFFFLVNFLVNALLLLGLIVVLAH